MDMLVIKDVDSFGNLTAKEDPRFGQEFGQQLVAQYVQQLRCNNGRSPYDPTDMLLLVHNTLEHVTGFEQLSEESQVLLIHSGTLYLWRVMDFLDLATQNGRNPVRTLPSIGRQSCVALVVSDNSAK